MKKSELANVIREELLSLTKESSNRHNPDMELASDKYKQSDHYKAHRVGFGVGDGEKQFDDDVIHNKATKGARGKEAKGVAAQSTAALKAQDKKKALSTFMDKMKADGVVSGDNKVLDAGKYKEEFARFKTSI